MFRITNEKLNKTLASKYFLLIIPFIMGAISYFAIYGAQRYGIPLQMNVTPEQVVHMKKIEPVAKEIVAIKKEIKEREQQGLENNPRNFAKVRVLNMKLVMLEKFFAEFCQDPINHPGFDPDRIMG